MRFSRSVYFYLPAILTECALFLFWLAEPIYIRQKLGGSAVDVGILGTANGGLYALLAFVVGMMCQRCDKRRMALFGAAVQIPAALALPFCDDLTTFMTICILHNGLMGFYWTPMMAMFSESLPPRELSRALGRWNVSWCLGAILGSVICGLLYERLSPAAPFIAAAALMTVSAGITLLGRPPREASLTEEERVPHPRGRYFMRQGWLLLICNSFMISLLIYIFPTLAQSLPKPVSPEVISRLQAVRMGGMLLTFALMGVTAGWHFRHYPLALAYGLLISMIAAIAMFERAWLFTIPFAALGVMMGIAYCASIYYSMLTPSARGAKIGINEMVLNLGGIIGPIFSGVLIKWSGDAQMPFWVGIVPLGAACLIFLGMWLRSSREGLRLKRTGSEPAQPVLCEQDGN